MRYFIADNEITQVATLARLLRGLDPTCEVRPEPLNCFSTWSGVESSLLQDTENSEELAVILDLSLESQHLDSVTVGVKKAFQLRSLRQSAVFIAFTQFGRAAEDEPHYEETFDGLIDKQRLHSQETIDDQQTYIRQVIAAAVRRRGKQRRGYGFVDSIGLRLAVAAIGDDGLDYIVEEVARGWKEIQLAALSSGHSGAFLIAISGLSQGAPQRIIIKYARDRKIIEGDTQRIREHMSELGPLGESMAPADQTLHELPSDLGFYYRQAQIVGETLLNELKRLPWGGEARALLDQVLALEIRCYDRGSGPHFGRVNGVERFPLTSVDVGRATQSLEFLRDAALTCEELRAWPNLPSDAKKLVSDLQNVISSWPSRVQSIGDLYVVAQHGDLNLGNVLVPGSAKIVLIDFGRLGRWPVGYDIARLATMCRIQLTDANSARDWVDNRLSHWVQEEFCAIEFEVDPARTNTPSALYCDQAFRSFILKCKSDDRRTLVQGYQLCTLWDLIKILSYTDISVYKRLWAMIAAWRLARALEFH